MVVYLDNEEDQEFFHVYFGHPTRRGRANDLLHNCAGKLFDTTGCADKDVGSVLLHDFLDCGELAKTLPSSSEPMSTNFR